MSFVASASEMILRLCKEKFRCLDVFVNKQANHSSRNGRLALLCTAHACNQLLGAYFREPTNVFKRFCERKKKRNPGSASASKIRSQLLSIFSRIPRERLQTRFATANLVHRRTKLFINRTGSLLIRIGAISLSKQEADQHRTAKTAWARRYRTI